MSNMSYCRFENTLNDLRDANEHLTIRPSVLREMSDDEHKAMVDLIKLCHEIARDYPLEDLE